MQLKSSQLVVFEDGHTEGYLEARWSDRKQAFYSFTEEGEKIYSTMVIEKPARKKRKFTPNQKNCTIQIMPCGETEKAYIVEDGCNGYITRGNRKEYYKYIAKSICYTDENGNVFAPKWV